MKLMKFIPTVAACAVLAACSTAENVASSAANAVSGAATAVTDTVSTAGSVVVNTVGSAGEAAANTASATANAVANPTGVKNTSVATATQKVATTSRSVVYQCLNKVQISATYAYEGETPKAVNLRVGKKAINGLVYDSSNKDAVTFKSNKYFWELDNSFLNDVNQADGMLTEDGKNSDVILGKLCKVNKSATKRINN